MNVNDWAHLFGMVTSTRTLMIHHRGEAFGAHEGNGDPCFLGVVVSVVATAVGHNRSSVCKNGLRAMCDMFRCGWHYGTFVRSRSLGL